MNLLFLSNVMPTPWRSGQGMFNAELVRALRARGHTVRSVTPVPWLHKLKARTGTMPEGSEGDFPTFWYPPGAFRASYDRWMWWSIKRTLQRACRPTPDALIAFWVHPDGTCAVRFARNLGIPALVIAGGSDLLVVTSDMRRERRIRETLGAATAVLAEGEHLVARAIALGASPDTTHLFRRGVDPTHFHPGSQAAARASVGLAPGHPVILWVGNMVPVKGLDLLLQAHALLPAPQPRLVMIGDGPMQRELADLARTLGTGNVDMVGRVPHAALAAWYRAADVFVLPSVSEGTPNVLQEATACGVPFVATDVGAVRSLMTAADRVVGSRIPRLLADAILDVLSTPGERHGKVPVARAWDHAVDDIERVLQQRQGRGS